MKKQLIAAAVAGAFALPAMAQNTVISGSIQMGVIDSGAPGAKAIVRHFGGGLNALNITTTEDLGGGMTGGASFQIRYLATGQLGNASQNVTTQTATPTFHNANVFLGSKELGTLRVGKIAEDGNCAFDPWGCGGGAGSIAGFHGSTTISGNNGLIFASSMDSSVRYESPRWNGLNVNYHTTLQAAPAGQVERTLANLTYTGGNIFAQYIQGETFGKTKESGAGVRYNFGFMTASLNTAVTKTLGGAKTRDMTMLSASVPLRPGLTGLFGYSKDNSRAANADTKWGLGVDYALSKRTVLGADVFEQEAASGSTGYVRLRHAY